MENLLRKTHSIFLNWDSHTLKTNSDLRRSAFSEIAQQQDHKRVQDAPALTTSHDSGYSIE